MAQIMIPNLPDALYARLKERATRHATTIEDEVVRCLEASVNHAARDAAAILNDVRRLRGSLGRVHGTDAELQAARADGRE